MQRAVFGIIAAVSSIGAASAMAACAEDRVDLRGPFGTAGFRIEVADDPAERARGLMFRENLAASAGMLFVYEDEQPVSFWMRNTLIPLDMIFADAQGRVVRVHAEAQPLDETPIPSGAPSQFVLEINGGLAASIGITEGAELRHPAIDQGMAAWPCE